MNSPKDCKEILSFDIDGGTQTSICDSDICIGLDCKGSRYLYFNDVQIIPTEGACMIKIYNNDNENETHSEEINETVSICQRPNLTAYPYFDLYFNDHIIEQKKCTFSKIIKVQGKCKIVQTVYDMVDS